ncbi:Ger(x)C family spore germination protein [Siminovitchia fordii]|uniref:Ger(x)C family spore germination protein n=1 Tax=Siminovitchia fordii TaxID=254759 RepID=UPI001BB43930|nr:Ger(x)C family spore germination protein [Siminovitchia fordii]
MSQRIEESVGQSVGKVLKNSLIRKSIFLAVFAGGIFFLAGCWDRIEINDLAIVTATGIDKSEDGQVVLSLEIFIPKNMTGGEGGNGLGGGEQQTTMVTYHKGRNIAEALSKLQAEMPRKIYWGSCKIFIFGDAVAKDGIQEHVDFLLRHPQPRERAFILVSRGKAKKILDTKATLERFSSETLREIANKKHGMSVTLQELDTMLTSKDQNVVLPYLKILKEKSDGKKTQYTVLEGTVLFKKDRMIGTISESTTRGLLWITDKLKEYTVTFEIEEGNGHISIFPVKTEVNLTPRIQNGEWKMIVDVHTEGTIVQNGTTLDLDDRKSERKINKVYRDKVEERIRKAIEAAQEHGLDVVGYGREFHQKYPQQWKKVEGRWEEVFPEVKTEFHIHANIRRQGYINEPIKTKGQK